MQNHISPNIGHMRVDSIKPIHIINLLDMLGQDGSRKDNKSGGLADSSIYQVDKALRSLFDRAKEWQLIKESPMQDLRRPRIKKKEMNYLDENGAFELLAALNNIDLLWRMYFITAMIGGLRRGENLSQEWEHFNFKENFIRVTQNILIFKNRLPVIKETKTGVS